MDIDSDIGELPRRDPGPLRGGARLVLHSYQAAALVRGRRPEPARDGQPARPAIFGLFAFASLLNTIREGAEEHDPYARWWLRRIDAALDQADLELYDLQDLLNEEADTDERYKLDVCASVRPAVFELRFSHSQAYRAARLIAGYDFFVLDAMTLRFHTMVPAAVATDLLHVAGRVVRRGLVSPAGYRRTGVRYADIRARNALAEKARSLMGPLPEDWAGGQASEGQTTADLPAAGPPAAGQPGAGPDDDEDSSVTTSSQKDSSVLTAVR